KLLSEGFARSGADTERLTDPIEDTPMVVTLDQLRPYDLNPRVTRNPRYDDLKASIRERGLDAPPAITRRPGEPTYTIRNGGNTRLAILSELWRETRDERYFRITCLFRPWSARGEIVALTGHLTENELHGGLSFIERALGIEKARELYEAEDGQPLSQSELSRRLCADGYPVSQSHISRMQDTIRYLLPAIPTLLYAGLGRPQTERLTSLRKAGERVWSSYATKGPGLDFTTLFQDVLTLFDPAGDDFSLQRVQDELVGQMAQVLEVDYDTLVLAIDSVAHRQRTLETPPPEPSGITEDSNPPAIQKTPVSPDSNHPSHSVAKQHMDDKGPSSPLVGPAGQSALESTPSVRTSPAECTPHQAQAVNSDAPIASAPSTTDRLQSIQHLLAAHTGESAMGAPSRGANTGTAEPSLDSPDQLRATICELAIAIADEIGEGERVSPADTGTGFTCRSDSAITDDQWSQAPSHPLLCLLLEIEACCSLDPPTAARSAILPDIVRSLLGEGTRAGQKPIYPISDNGLNRLFQLIHLTRQLRAWALSDGPEPTGKYNRR
ncbi:MAG: ParB family protein, partial [Parahaliea sp.]